MMDEHQFRRWAHIFIVTMAAGCSECEQKKKTDDDVVYFALEKNNPKTKEQF